MISRRSASNITIFAIVLLLALLSTFPIKLAAVWAAGEGSSFAARDAEGSVWTGRLLDLRIAGIALGSPDAVAMPFSVPGGEPVLSLKWTGQDGLRGRAAFSSRGASVNRLTGVVAPTAAFAGRLPIASLAMQDFSYRSREGRCGTAAGTIRARLSGPMSETLTGAARCDRRALLLLLRAPGQSLTMRFEASRYTIELRGSGSPVLRERGTLGGRGR